MDIGAPLPDALSQRESLEQICPADLVEKAGPQKPDAGSVIGFLNWPVFVLGHRFSGLVAIQPGHRLVTDGIYGVIRHPSYLGLLVTSLGWALAFRSGVGLLLTLASTLVVLGRIQAEEKLLGSHFGAEYEAYRRRTSRLIPGVY